MGRIGRRALFIGLALIVLAGSAAWLYRSRTRRMFILGPPDIRLFVEREPKPDELKTLYTGAKYEPRMGSYLGAYIDLDPNLKTVATDRTSRNHKLPSEFEDRVGKSHASYLIYQLYGARTFPMDWVERLAAEGKFVHIALEPNRGLDTVKDDAYLQNLAAKLGKSKAKIFLRFASEMNGPWTKYHGDPAKYIEKWRLVARVMREKAPNVAMVWCPYVTPQALIDRYYPGDEWVDWVGVNMYSVTYYNQDRRFPGLDDHPADMLRYVYDRYSRRKPIMICEYGAASYSAFEDADTSRFAIEKIRALYWSLPRIFPRVKGVTYFSSNNMEVAHRRNNDYSVLAKPDVLAAYRDATAPAYFLESHGDRVERVPMEVKDGDSIPQGADLSIWMRGGSRVEARFEGRALPTRAVDPGYEIVGWPGGAGKLVLRLLDGSGSLVLERALGLR